MHRKPLVTIATACSALLAFAGAVWGALTEHQSGVLLVLLAMVLSAVALIQAHHGLRNTSPGGQGRRLAIAAAAVAYLVLLSFVAVFVLIVYGLSQIT